jgi:hypothetical protein
MKTELVIFTVFALVASIYLNKDASTQTQDQLAATKSRIEQAAKNSHSLKNKEAVIVTKAAEKPTEG